MNEIIVKLGGKEEYATDTQAAQTEALEPLQAYFKQFGACIIDGCAITANGGNWDIAPGIVAIEHAEGFKIARFAGVTNEPLPGHLVIDEDIVNGVYLSGADEVFRNYTAVWVDGAPGVSDNTVLPFDTPTNAVPQTFFRASGKSANSAPFTINTTIFNIPSSQPIKCWINDLSRTLHIQAEIVVKDYAALPEAMYPLSQTLLPLKMRPATPQSFTAYVLSGSSYPFVDVQGKDYIRMVHGYVDTGGGLFMQIVKPITGANYTVRINAVLQLD